MAPNLADHTELLRPPLFGVKETSVLDGDASLMRQRLKHAQICIIKSIEPIALSIQDAYDLSPGLDRNSQL